MVGNKADMLINQSLWRTNWQPSRELKQSGEKLQILTTLHSKKFLEYFSSVARHRVINVQNQYCLLAHPAADLAK